MPRQEQTQKQQKKEHIVKPSQANKKKPDMMLQNKMLQNNTARDTKLKLVSVY